MFILAWEIQTLWNDNSRGVKMKGYLLSLIFVFVIYEFGVLLIWIDRNFVIICESNFFLNGRLHPQKYLHIKHINTAFLWWLWYACNGSQCNRKELKAKNSKNWLLEFFFLQSRLTVTHNLIIFSIKKLRLFCSIS